MFTVFAVSGRADLFACSSQTPGPVSNTVFIPLRKSGIPVLSINRINEIYQRMGGRGEVTESRPSANASASKDDHMFAASHPLGQ